MGVSQIIIEIAVIIVSSIIGVWAAHHYHNLPPHTHAKGADPSIEDRLEALEAFQKARAKIDEAFAKIAVLEAEVAILRAWQEQFAFRNILKQFGVAIGAASAGATLIFTILKWIGVLH